MLNDRFGHQAGDHVLVTLVELMARTLRETAVLTRYGGEEFVVITPHTSLAEATALAQRVLASIESHRSVLPDEPSGIMVTCSVGVASLDSKIDNKDRLLHTADANL